MMTSCPNSLSIDIETYSSVDLSKSGTYRYVESDDFEILLFGFSVNGSDVQVVDLANGEMIPPAILSMLTDDNVIKYAFNASFERICLSKFLGYPTGIYLNPASWRCTMVASAYLGLPLSLQGVGTVLSLDKQKLSEGKDLIKYFCVPCTPTKSNGGRTRNLPMHDSKKWSEFKKYNLRDVETEMEIKEKLKNFPVPKTVWDEYYIDQVINDRGVLLDIELVDCAIKIDTLSRDKLISLMKELTSIDNPNSVMQLKEWLLQNNVETDDLSKKTVEKLKEVNDNSVVGEVLSLRQQLSKSSLKKYQAMKNVVCSDGRARGMFQFYGANRTGRWAGRLIQVQNLPRNYLDDLVEVRDLIKSFNIKALNMLYDNIPDILSQLIRTAFIPKEGYKFIVSDFSSIEARVLAWYADEAWRIAAFKRGEDIYCASASQMFGVPVVKSGVNSHLRQKGKIAELALGYGGSVGALKAMGAIEMGLTEDELEPLVRIWRMSNPSIVQFWWDIDRIVINVVRNKTFDEAYGLRFEYRSGILQITLPSGRMLSYIKPKIELNQFGSECVSYEGIGQSKKWERIQSYGPKFVENIVQATARDILAFALLNLKRYEVVMHIHDEVVIEVKDEDLESINKLMRITPSWAKGLILDADGFITEFYRKD